MTHNVIETIVDATGDALAIIAKVLFPEIGLASVIFSAIGPTYKFYDGVHDSIVNGVQDHATNVGVTLEEWDIMTPAIHAAVRVYDAMNEVGHCAEDRSSAIVDYMH